MADSANWPFEGNDRTRPRTAASDDSAGEKMARKRQTANSMVVGTTQLYNKDGKIRLIPVCHVLIVLFPALSQWLTLV